MCVCVCASCVCSAVDFGGIRYPWKENKRFGESSLISRASIL